MLEKNDKFSSNELVNREMKNGLTVTALFIYFRELWYLYMHICVEDEMF